MSRGTGGSERSDLVRWTLGSAAVGACAFFVMSVATALIARTNPLEQLGPVAALTVIGFTVGGLVGPLVRGLVERRRHR